MSVHSLKCWPEPFEAILRGVKNYEIRKDDRNFQVGDILQLEEWSPETQAYSGDFVVRQVMYKTAGGQWGLPADLCVLALQIPRRGEP